MNTLVEPSVREHELKCWPGQYDAILSGDKAFEYRNNDRDFQADDVLHLRRFQPVGQVYTGEEMRVRVTYVLRSGFGLPDGYAVLSLESPLTQSQAAEIERLRAALECIAGTTASEHGTTPMMLTRCMKFAEAALTQPTKE